jgi:hypothetical protein
VSELDWIGCELYNLGFYWIFLLWIMDVDPFPRLVLPQHYLFLTLSGTHACMQKRCAPFRLTYQPPASSTFLSEQTNHQQSASITFISEQTTTPPAKPTRREHESKSGTGYTVYPGSRVATTHPVWRLCRTGSSNFSFTHRGVAQLPNPTGCGPKN